MRSLGPNTTTSGLSESARIKYEVIHDLRSLRQTWSFTNCPVLCFHGVISIAMKIILCCWIKFPEESRYRVKRNQQQPGDKNWLSFYRTWGQNANTEAWPSVCKHVCFHPLGYIRAYIPSWKTLGGAINTITYFICFHCSLLFHLPHLP